MYIRDTVTSASNFESVFLNVQPNTIIYFDTSSMMQGVNASLIPITASWAMTASVSNTLISIATASWASQSFSSSYTTTASFANTASYIATTNYAAYSTLITSSTYWITCSFLTASQVVSFTTGSVTYAFTSSNHPTSGQYADVILYITNSLTGNSASLSFPATWTNVAGSWPTSIAAGKSAIVWLRAYDTNTVIGTYNKQA